MKQTKATISRNLKALRKLIDTTDDPMTARVAYAMETAVRWATEDTVGWESLVEQAKGEADLLKKLLAN